MAKRHTQEDTISDKVKAIGEKLQADATGDSLTRGEKSLEVTRDEAAYLLSIIADRAITGEYIRQLTRPTRKNGQARLIPARPAANSYLFTVDSLLNVRFIETHKQGA